MRSRLLSSKGFAALATITALLAPGSAGAQPRARPSATLPLKTVRLYEAGVGYFERTGKLVAGSDVSLPVPPSHLDDALKTLVVLGDDGKTRVDGIEFASTMSQDMGRALAGLPESGASTTYADLLSTVRGATVELRTASETVRGRLVDVVAPGAADEAQCAAPPPPSGKGEPAAAAAPCALTKAMTLVLLSEHAEIRRFRAADVIAVRPTDPAVATRLDSGLRALAPVASEAQRKLRVMASGGAGVTLGYVAETAVWRSTYRLVFEPAADRGVLQAWVLLHNDSEEDWNKVHVDLVNGRPDSFLFPLAAPRYARRELVTPDDQLSTVPQLLGTTVDHMWGDAIGESFGAGGLGLSGVGEGGGGRGEGIGLGTVGTLGKGSGVAQSGALDVGNLASINQADAVESGALFRYALPSAIDLRAHGSALLPFLQRPISARRIAWFAQDHQPARSGVRLKNDTQQTLPAGPIAFFGDGGFAGEATLDRLKPTEVRFLAFGSDLDVELENVEHETTDDTQLLSFAEGVLTEHFLRHHHIGYRIVNKSGSGRTVYVGLDVVSNARVTGADEVDFDPKAKRAHAVFQVEGKKEAERTVEIDEGLSRTTKLAALTARALREMGASDRVPQAQRELVRRAAAEIAEAETCRVVVPRRQADLAEYEADLSRLQGHLRALGRDAPGAAEIVRRILKLEDRVKAMHVRIAELGQEEAEHKTRAERILLGLAPARPSTRQP